MFTDTSNISMLSITQNINILHSHPMKKQHFYFSPQICLRGVVLKLSCLSDSHGPSTYTGHACLINYQTTLYQWGPLAYLHEWSDLHMVWFLHVTFSCPWVPYIYRMKNLDKSVVSRQSCRGYRMLKGTRQWACCRLGSQNARWRAISTAHHPLYPGYGNGTWKLTLLMIGRAPDGKKLRLQSRTSISWPSISATDSVLLHKLPQRLQEYASHGSAPVRSAAGSTRSTWALAHLRLSHFWHHLGSKTVSTGPGYTKTGLRCNGEVSSSLTNRGFVCTPSTDVKECGDDLERGMPPAAYISTTDGKVMVWAAISFDHKSPLVVIEGNMTALRYIAQILRPTLLPLLAQHRDVITFQQDNARPHTARITMAFLGEHGVNVLPWPAYSPDMSPIEHLWDQLGRRIRNLNPRPLTRPQLIAALHGQISLRTVLDVLISYSVNKKAMSCMCGATWWPYSLLTFCWLLFSKPL